MEISDKGSIKRSSWLWVTDEKIEEKGKDNYLGIGMQKELNKDVMYNIFVNTSLLCIIREYSH